jgi:SMODS-associating 2TM, beta-strand rich effector domain
MMARPSKPLIQALVAVFALTYAAQAVVRREPVSGEILSSAGVAVTAGAALVWLVDNVLWRVPILGRLITARPDLRGTWAGELRSTWTDPETSSEREADPHVYLVVRQRYWSIGAELLTRESSSEPVSAELTRSDEGSFRLTLTYRNTPRAAVRERSEMHLGTVVLKISGSPPHGLEGNYFTDRCTTGELTFDARSPEYAGDWESASRLFPHRAHTNEPTGQSGALADGTDLDTSLNPGRAAHE